MGITLDQLTAEEADAILTLRGEPFAVRFRPGVYTPKFAAEAAAEVGEVDGEGRPINAGKAASDKLIDMVCRLLVTWELRVDAEAEDVLPVNAETVALVPLGFLSELMFELGRAMRPNPRTGATSAGGSRREASQDASPSGTGSFEPLGT